MLAAKYRFHGQRSLKAVFRHGAVVKGQHSLLRFQKNPRRNYSRAAVVVSKKITKKAYERNRIRRRIYEQLRLAFPSINLPHDLVVIVTSHHLLDLPAEQVAAEITSLLQKAQLLKK